MRSTTRTVDAATSPRPRGPLRPAGQSGTHDPALPHAEARVGRRRSLDDGGAMTDRSIVTVLLASLMIATGVPASAQQAKCLAGKTKCMSETSTGLLMCEQLAGPPGKPANPNTNDCVTKVIARFDGGV